MREHFEDEYVRRAREQGYRSRAVFKLLEIQEKDHLIRPGMTVVDLGAAPGGWSQVAARLVGTKGRVLASDILPMDEIPLVQFVCGDFTEPSVCGQIQDALGQERADVVLSDMAPNMSGVKEIDQPRVLYLAELALDMARVVLKDDGAFLVKVFQGSGLDAFQKDLRSSFRSVKVRKPRASRPRSPELYLLAEGFMAAD